MSRRAKRERLVAREYDEHVINSAESAQLASTEDADLFTIDRAGSKSKKRKIEKLGKQSELKKDVLVVSSTDQNIIARNAKRKDEEARATAARQALLRGGSRDLDVWAPATREKIKAKEVDWVDSKQVADLWDMPTKVLASRGIL